METSKAEKQAQTPNVPSSNTSNAQQGAQSLSPVEIHADEDTPQDGPRKLPQQSCICPFRDSNFAGIPGLSDTDFQADCRCGSAVEGTHQYVDSTNSIASFADMENAESLYLNLPSPESLQCNTPTIAFQDDFMGLDSLSGNSRSEQGSSSVRSSVLLELPSTPPLQQPYSRTQYPFTAPMGYQMVPMGYMPSLGKFPSFFGRFRPTPEIITNVSQRPTILQCTTGSMGRLGVLALSHTNLACKLRYPRHLCNITF